MDSQRSLYDLLFDRVPMGVAIFDSNLALQRCNPTWVDYIEKYTPTEAYKVVRGAYFFDIISGAEDDLQPLLKAALAGETVRLNAVKMQSGGIVSYWDQVYSPLIEDGRVVGILDIAIDATERVQAYQMLEQRVTERTMEIEKRRQVAEGLSEILAVLNSNQELEDVLEFIVTQACKLLGTDTAAIYKLDSSRQHLQVQCARGLPAEYINNVRIPISSGLIGEAVMGRHPLIIDDFPMFTLADDFARQDSARRELAARFGSLLAIPLVIKDEVYGGLVLFYHGSRKFLTEEVNLARSFGHQAALAIENARLRREVEKAAVNAERSRLARDLHDSVTQTLFSASLIAEVLPRLWDKNNDEAKKRLEELRQLARGALAEMRTLLLELRPTALLETDMHELLRHLCDAVNGRARLPVTLQISEQRRALPPDVKIAFYRIAQEAMNNITRHAAADAAKVCLEYGATNVTMHVSDNGRGFDPNRANNPDHFGLGIMRERAEAVGAQLTVDSRPGAGTTITLVWKG